MPIISGKNSRQRPIIDAYKEFVCHKVDNIRVVTVLLQIMLTISSNTAVCECGFSCMNRENTVLQTKLSEDILDLIMVINIYGPSLDNFDTEKFVSDWTESAVTSRHLNGHNSSRTEAHEEANENFIAF